MSDGKPRRGGRESVAGKVTNAFPRTAQIVNLPSPASPVVTDVPVVIAAPVAPVVTAPPEPPLALPPPMTAAAPVPPAKASANPWLAMVEAQGVIGRGYEQMLAEYAGFATVGMAVSRDAALAMLGAKTVSDAIAVSNDFVRKGIDAMIDGSAKLSEISVKTMTDISRPLLSQVRH